MAAGAYEKEFRKEFESLCGAKNAWTVWQDFVDMAAYTIANAVDQRKEVWDKRETAYLAIAKRYTKTELDTVVRLFSDTVMALEENPAQDFLGRLYMDLGFGGRSGQFFTPWDIAKLMAQIVIDSDMQGQIVKNGYVPVCDSSCGAGCMLIAFANLCQEKSDVNYQEQVLFIGQDIDPVVAKMCYIQISLLGCPGYVAIGNSLTEPIGGTQLQPAFVRPEDLWFTPIYCCTDTWCFRRACESVKALTNTATTAPEEEAPKKEQKKRSTGIQTAPKPAKDISLDQIRTFFRKGAKRK